MGWAILTGVSAGTGIWATHFVAMLAYDGGLPTTYDPILTLASLLIAVTLATAGFALSSFGGMLAVVTGGVILGSAIGAMHYIGMAALVVPGDLVWDASLVAASLVLGISVACGSLVVFHRGGEKAPIGLSGAVLTLAICTLHFTSMGAVVIMPDSTVSFDDFGLDRTLLAIAIAGVTLVVLIGAQSAGAIQRANIKFENTLREQNARFEDALRYLPVGFSMFDSQQRLMMCNGVYRDMYGLSETAAEPGTPFAHIMRTHAKREQNDCGGGFGHNEWIAGLMERLKSGKSFTDPIQLQDGRMISVRVGPMSGGGWVDIHEDITARSRQEAKIAFMALHDMLTGLPNRILLHDRLELALRNASEAEVALLFLDLDRFKEVNDTLGHRVGDALLKEVAHRLQRCVQESDVVARVGGDEFVVLTRAEGRVAASDLASKIIGSLSEPFRVEGHTLYIGTSIGISLSDEGVGAEALIGRADLALYRSKKESRGTFHFFEAEMDLSCRRRRSLEKDLRSALSNGEFEIHYQPIVNLARNDIVAFEALLRWKHPERGFVSPADFIPIAEETGLISSIGEWALRQACRDATSWPAPVKVAVNLSPIQFKGRALVETIFNAVAAAELAPHRLELEITESSLLQDGEETLMTLRRIRDLGVQIAMDDFGTGYSSLAYLQSFPFHKIKIDRRFISKLPDDGNSLAILRAICGLGKSLNLSIVAEGVETREQRAVIEREGCTEMQGYLFSKPKHVSETLEFFAGRKAEKTRLCRREKASRKATCRQNF